MRALLLIAVFLNAVLLFNFDYGFALARPLSTYHFNHINLLINSRHFAGQLPY